MFKRQGSWARKNDSRFIRGAHEQYKIFQQERHQWGCYFFIQDSFVKLGAIRKYGLFNNPVLEESAR